MLSASRLQFISLLEKFDLFGAVEIRNMIVTSLKAFTGITDLGLIRCSTWDGPGWGVLAPP